jgi:hypothetical protein
MGLSPRASRSLGTQDLKAKPQRKSSKGKKGTKFVSLPKVSAVDTLPTKTLLCINNDITMTSLLSSHPAVCYRHGGKALAALLLFHLVHNFLDS